MTSYCSLQASSTSGQPQAVARAVRVLDERDAVPQAVVVGAAELVGATEYSLDGGPMAPELEEHGAAAGSLEEGAASGSLEPG